MANAMSYELIDDMERLGTPRILVLGDLILDRYVWGDAERISQEAPVILLREDRQETRLGGAANVANMLRGLDAEVTLAGVVGNDADAPLVAQELARAGVDCSALVADDDRPTTCKVRFMGRAQHRHPHQMLRVDREMRHPIRTEIAQKLLDAMLPRLHEFQAVLISDYAKGVCTAEVVKPLIAAARAAGIPVVVDPAAGGDYNLYRGATGVTPNRSETQKATGIDVRSIDAAYKAGNLLVEKFGLDMAFVTLDRDGIVLARQDGEPIHLPTRIREVYDVTGAGDMVLAMFGLGMATGIEPSRLCRLANVAGGLEVEQVGVVRISRKEILTDLLHGTRRAAGKVCSLDELTRHVSARHKAGQKVVLTNGCFDLLHVGHISYLAEAAREGDCLIVAINSDDSVRRLNKAPERPIFDQEYRAAMLAGLESVDYVVVFDEDTPHAVLHALQPDILVKGGTYRDDEIVGREVVVQYGGRVKALGITPGVSTTEIVRRLREAELEPIAIPLPSVKERRAA
ncbi:MAG: cytidyltransferase-related domain protein [Schlesneria sp.]|nr:cytidyltransferase-related domain protein [Schlesneria sp.]